MFRNVRTGRGCVHVLAAGIVVIAGILPAVRYLSLIHPVEDDNLVAVLIFEATVCLAMLAGKLHWRMVGLEVRQAKALATALSGGRLDDLGG